MVLVDAARLKGQTGNGLGGIHGAAATEADQDLAAVLSHEVDTGLNQIECGLAPHLRV